MGVQSSRGLRKTARGLQKYLHIRGKKNMCIGVCVCIKISSQHWASWSPLMDQHFIKSLETFGSYRFCEALWIIRVSQSLFIGASWCPYLGLLWSPFLEHWGLITSPRKPLGNSWRTEPTSQGWGWQTWYFSADIDISCFFQQNFFTKFIFTAMKCERLANMKVLLHLIYWSLPLYRWVLVKPL